MRLLIISPQQPPESGNTVTARRLQRSLQQRGWTVDQLPLAPFESERLAAAIAEFRPDRLLLLHAFRSGKPWLEAGGARSIPTTVLLTGTDINHGLNDSVQGPVIAAVFDSAAAIVSQNRLTVAALREQSLDWTDRLHCIPPGVLLGIEPYPLRALHGFARHEQLFLHPAGIRPVKRNLELLQLCDPLAHDHTDFRLAFCGPVLDPDYNKRFQTALRKRPWAKYLGTIPSESMTSALKEVNLVLNHSQSEGLSNALLEALAVGCPVLARDITGNAALPDSGSLLRLYDSDAEFLQHASSVLNAPPAACRKPLSALPDSAAREAEQFAILLENLPH